MFILNYLHVPAGIPHLQACGLELWKRAALTLFKHHINPAVTILVHPQDAAVISAQALKDPRFRGIRVTSSHNNLERAGASPTHPITILAAGYFSLDHIISLTEQTSPSMTGNIFYYDRPGNLVAATFHDAADWTLNSLNLLNHFSSYCPNPGETRITIDMIQPVTAADDVPAIEDHLINQLTKKADGLISRSINRHISLFLTRRLAKTTVTPNQITALVFLIGIGAGPAIFFIGGYAGFLAGGFLYYFSAILDGCDGEISRLKFMGTPLGAWLDTLTDDLIGFSFVIGLYLGLFNQQPLWKWFGIVTAACYLLTLIPRYYTMKKYLNTGDFQKLTASKPQKVNPEGLRKFANWLEYNIFRTDFMAFSAFIAVLFNVPELYAAILVPTSIASVIEALLVYFRFRNNHSGSSVAPC